MLSPISSLSLSLSALPASQGSVSSSLMLYVHRGSSNPHQLQGSPIWHQKSMLRATPCRLKAFRLVPALLVSRPPCSKLYLPGAQKAGCEEPTWYCCPMLNFLQFCFASHNRSFYVCLQVLTFWLQISHLKIFVWTKRSRIKTELKPKWRRAL